MWGTDEGLVAGPGATASSGGEQQGVAPAGAEHRQLHRLPGRTGHVKACTVGPHRNALAPGSRLTVDFNKATLPHHLLSPEVFTCPASPPGNHVAIPVEAGERKFTYRENHSAPTHFEGNSAMSNQDLADKVTAYLRHLEKRDWAAARTLCADNATVWHSDGKGDSGIDENINGMTEGMDGIKSIKYTITRQLSQGDDVLQQHVLDVVTTDGADVRMSVAAYFGFTDGLISRIEEYGSPPAGWEES